MGKVVALGMALLALVANTGAAEAAPARVRVFEAAAHAAADVDSPVVHTFIEGTEVSVSEKADEGWRKVRLPDGTSGFIADDDVALVMSEPRLPPSPPLSVEPVPAPKPVTIYVRDLSHLAQLVKPDPLVGPRAASLATRRTVALGTALLGITAGTIMMVGAVSLWTTQECSPIVGCKEEANWMLFTAGGGLTFLSSIVPLLIAPRQTEILDVINRWNERHPDHQFEIGTGSTARH